MNTSDTRFKNSLKIKSLLALTLVVALTSLGACKPNYPRCDNDKHCAIRGEVCVNGQCQECREELQCTAKYPHEQRSCLNGRCELESDCTKDTDCAHHGHGWLCKQGHCAPECSKDAECGTGRQCVSHKCVVECIGDSECPDNQACVDGTCTSDTDAQHHSCRPTKAGDLVELPTVHFEFNQFDLTEQSRQTLAQVARCLSQAPADLQVTLEGHCDDRGTQEYNLALGDRRAQSVSKYLKTLGAPAQQLKTVSKGENEPVCSEANEACYTRNRRVDFIQHPGTSAH